MTGLLHANMMSVIAVMLGAEPVEECVLPDVVVWGMPFEARAPADLSLERAEQALLTSADGQKAFLLQAPCTTTALPSADAGTLAVGAGNVFTAVGGRTVYLSDALRVSGPGEAPRTLEPPAKARRAILSNDGRSIAWLVEDPAVAPKYVQDRGTYAVPRVQLRSLDTGEETFVPLPAGSLANVEASATLPQLLAVDTQAKEVLVALEDTKTRAPYFVSCGFDGKPKLGPVTTPGVARGLHEALGFRRVGASGWVSWGDPLNADDDPLVVLWSLAGKSGKHQVWSPVMPAQHPKIDGASVSADGAYVAVSVGLHTRMKLGNARTYVFRTKDGKTVWEHEHSGANGSSVAFLGNERFCFSDFDAKKARHQTWVVKLPKP